MLEEVVESLKNKELIGVTMDMYVYPSGDLPLFLLVNRARKNGLDQ